MAERQALAALTQRFAVGTKHWLKEVQAALSPLLQPIYDVLKITAACNAARNSAIHLLVEEMHLRRTTFWAWTEAEWLEVLCPTEREFHVRHRWSGNCRQYVIAISYLLSGFTNIYAIGTFFQYRLAIKVFGQAAVDEAMRRVREDLQSIGYGSRAKSVVPTALYEALLLNRSPRLEDLTIEVLEAVRQQSTPYIKRGVGTISHTLQRLGIITRTLSRTIKADDTVDRYRAVDDVPLQWTGWCLRWRDTSTLAPSSRTALYYNMLKVGRWLAHHHPDVLSLGLWTRELALEYVAAVDRMRVGEWEHSEDARLKQKLITYNAEDCEAAEKVATAITQLGQRQSEAITPKDDSIVHVASLKREYPQRFGRIDFTLPELASINQAAYWDYQREKIYVRSSQRIKRVSRQATRGRAKALPVNKVVEGSPPACCPQCQAIKFYKHGKYRKIVHDLLFTRSGIKRWTVKYRFNRYHCYQCGATFWPQQRHLTKGRFGPGLLSYVVYQTIELKLPQRLVGQSLKQLFELDLSYTAVNHLKAQAAELYKPTYERILNNISHGSLLHADETSINIARGSGYVWVFTNLEEVAFYYTATREGEFLQTFFGGFEGVLVSDFYAAYDSMNCPQQKCLIHLMRDLNDDLHKQPFNEELKSLVQEFTMLLKPMVETVDRFGLKAHFLRRHKVFVERFYMELLRRDHQSEVAIKYKKRFEKNREKLFTFLDHDGVPWNNNNAEHAVKAFAMLRNVIRGSSSDKGIREYLILLSICETCKYKGANFLDFLRSGEKDIDEFVEKTSYAGSQRFTPSKPL